MFVAKKIIYTTLLVIWMIVIFMFSNDSGTSSLSKSDRVARNTINTVSKITKKKYTESKKDKIIKNTRFIIRKTAHFTLYFILGVLVYLTFRSYGISNRVFIYSILFCLVYAISDEIHQLISSDRTARVLDVLIDTSGSIVSNFIIYMINYKKKFA